MSEMDDETGLVNYKYRMHDPRVGRFFSCDPLEKNYPYLTPYQFSSNQPIHARELEGLESADEIQPVEPIEVKAFTVINTFGVPMFIDSQGNISNQPVAVTPSAAETRAINNQGINANSWGLTGPAHSGTDNMSRILINPPSTADPSGANPYHRFVDRLGQNSQTARARNFNWNPSGVRVPGMPFFQSGIVALNGISLADPDGDTALAPTANLSASIRSNIAAFNPAAGSRNEDIVITLSGVAGSSSFDQIAYDVQAQFGDNATIVLNPTGLTQGQTSANDTQVTVTFSQATETGLNEQAITP